VLEAAQAYEPLLSRSKNVRCNVSVFSPVILIPFSGGGGSSSNNSNKQHEMKERKVDEKSARAKQI